VRESARILGIPASDSSTLIRRVRQGFPFATVERLQQAFALSTDEITTLVQIPTRTMTRRKVSGRLKADESDRVLRAVRLMQRATVLFNNDPAAAKTWMKTLNAALAGPCPSISPAPRSGPEVEDALGALKTGCSPDAVRLADHYHPDPDRAFSGDGARIRGGRWNSKGTRVVYAADYPAAAILEQLVQVSSVGSLPIYNLFRVTLLETMVSVVDSGTLRGAWHDPQRDPAVQAIGDAWVAKRTSLALQVPARLHRTRELPAQPAHPDFATLTIAAPERFALDPRLLLPAPDNPLPRRPRPTRSQPGAPAPDPRVRPGLPRGRSDPLGFGVNAVILQWPGVIGQEIVWTQSAEASLLTDRERVNVGNNVPSPNSAALATLAVKNSGVLLTIRGRRQEASLYERFVLRRGTIWGRRSVRPAVFAAWR
jgi:putative toxin-antitoxin system antitoxin component (TIGR02293 family)